MPTEITTHGANPIEFSGDMEGYIVVDEAKAAIARCPKCSECPDRGHHWLIGCMDPDDDEAVAEFKASHPQVKPTRGLLEAHVACKHCPAVRRYDDRRDSERP
jgi:hypothetical protein